MVAKDGKNKQRMLLIWLKRSWIGQVLVDYPCSFDSCPHQAILLENEWEWKSAESGWVRGLLLILKWRSARAHCGFLSWPASFRWSLVLRRPGWPGPGCRHALSWGEPGPRGARPACRFGTLGEVHLWSQTSSAMRLCPTALRIPNKETSMLVRLGNDCLCWAGVRFPEFSLLFLRVRL